MTIIEKLKFEWEILFEEHIRLAWDDFIDKYFIFPWERFQAWRRKRNPELVELDAFRETVRIEKKLKDYPNAVPLLTELMAAYKITGEEDKLFDVMRRLRDINPPPKPEEPPRTLADDLCDEIGKDLYLKTVALLSQGVKARASNLDQALGISHSEAKRLCDLLLIYDIIDPETLELH